MIRWLPQVEAKDYAAAYRFLTAHGDANVAGAAQAALRRAPYGRAPAAHIVRLTNFNPLPLGNPNVQRHAVRMGGGEAFSPILLVTLPDDRTIVADGHHRLSLAYDLDPGQLVPYRRAILRPRAT